MAALFFSVVRISIAGEIPEFLSENLNNPRKNICPFLCNVMYVHVTSDGEDTEKDTGSNSQKAIALAEKQAELKRSLALQVYADGLTTRTLQLKRESEEQEASLKNINMGFSFPKDKKGILDDIQPHLVNIANSLSRIAALQAEIAAMDGVIRISRDPGKDESDILGICNCDELINASSGKNSKEKANEATD